MKDSSNRLVYLNPDSFNITTNSECDIVTMNIKRYKTILFPRKLHLQVPDNNNNSQTLDELRIIVNEQTSCPDLPDSNMDEFCKKP